MSFIQQDKLKALFHGLRKSTNRGIRKCFKCGTINGTRGNSCKNRACDVLFRKTEGASKKASTDACKLETNIPGVEVYSVRQRDRGPDYRSFVHLSSSSLADFADSETPCILRNGKCYKASCNKNKNIPCGHIEAAQRCFSEAEALIVKESTASVLSVPSDQQQTLSAYLSEVSTLVQRVSKTTFVTKCDVTKAHPLGYLHIMFFQNKKEERVEKKFLCSCKPLKGKEGDSPNANDIGESTKLCIHYHACLMAFASDSNLALEFSEFLTGHCPQTLLSQLHVVTLPQSVGATSLDGIDPNQISVEIMQDNISLLESIAAVDDVTLHSVQGLEAVLSDQIIVANVEDSLNFGDTSALLDDADSQVCQLFPSGIQLASPFSNNDSVLETINLTAAAAVLTSTTTSVSNPFKRQRTGDNDKDGGYILPITGSRISPSQSILTTESYENNSKDTKPRVSDVKCLPSTTITFSSPTSKSFYDSLDPPSPPNSHVPDKPLDDFEIWLCGVNERLNAVMNYKFSGKPDPIVYYISLEYFERLRERITSGAKKKRLPNQTVIITRTDKPPAGSFTKHVWRITNMTQVLQIFHSQVVPLKIRQYFIKGVSGLYENWTPPHETDRKNQAIKPHLHTTFLKVGKLDPYDTENIPFVIEWIPDILPQSKLGELSLIFEFGHQSPTSRNDRSLIL